MKSPCSLSVYPPIVARQRFGKRVPAAANTHATIEELLVASFYMNYVMRLTYMCGLVC
jgi:hypothetical protein